MRHALGRFPLFVGVLILLVAVAGCTSGGGGPAPKSDPDVDALIRRYIERSIARDSQGLADMFTDPAKWTDPTGTQDSSRAKMKDLFDMMFDVVIDIYAMEATNVRSTVSGDDATVQFTGKQDVENAFLGRVQSEVDTTWQLKRIAGQWYIAHAQTTNISSF